MSRPTGHLRPILHQLMMRFAPTERGPECDTKADERSRGWQGLFSGQPPRALSNSAEEFGHDAARICLSRLLLGRNLGWPVQGDKAAGGMTAKLRNRLFDSLHHARCYVVLGRWLVVWVFAGRFAMFCNMMSRDMHHLDPVARLGIRRGG